METKNTEGAWAAIPGFSRYRINTVTREIQSMNKSGGREWRTLKVHTNGHVGIRSDKNKTFAGSPNRLLYCALHNVNPQRLDSNLFVIEAKDGTLRLFDRREFNQFRIKDRPTRTEAYIKGEYEKAKRVIDIILTAYKTEDYTQVVAEIWSYEGKIKDFLKIRNLAFNKDRIEEIWMQVFDITIDAIKKRKAYIVNVLGYLKRVAITIVTNERKIKERVRSLETMTGTPRAMRVEPEAITL